MLVRLLPSRLSACLAGLAAPLFALCASGVAQAQILEIDAKGNSHYRTGAGAVIWVGEVDDVGPDNAATELPPAALTPLDGLLIPSAYRASLVRAASHAAISPALLEALVWQESRWRPGAISSAGAMGLGQLMPGTARELGVNPRDPDENLLGAAIYLRQQLDRFDNDIELALAAYNAGPARVERARAIPAIAETRAYVAAITGRLSAQASSE